MDSLHIFFAQLVSTPLPLKFNVTETQDSFIPNAKPSANMGTLNGLLALSTCTNWAQLTGLLTISLLTLSIYRRYFSPISHVPGPFVASFTRLWHIDRILKGDQNLELIRLHDKHGM